MPHAIMLDGPRVIRPRWAPGSSTCAGAGALLRIGVTALLLVAGHAEDAATRPAVLLIGDSISKGYATTAIAALRDVADARRIADNGQDTRFALTRLDQWLGDTRWAVIHCNWGLWDLKNAGKAVPLAEYRANIERIAGRLQASGARIVFATTTPVPEKNRHGRREADVIAYNAAAVEIMRAHGAEINDLHATALPQLAAWQNPGDVHFRPLGSHGLGEQVARSIRAALDAGEPAKPAPAGTAGAAAADVVLAVGEAPWLARLQPALPAGWQVERVASDALAARPAAPPVRLVAIALAADATAEQLGRLLAAVAATAATGSAQVVVVGPTGRDDLVHQADLTGAVWIDAGASAARAVAALIAAPAK